MLAKVTRPDHRTVTFKYDALGRRIEKCFNNTTTKWVWDGNVPLHEWKEIHSEENVTKQLVTTWVFEEGTFVPVAKLTEEKKLSIATNYMGTPEVMYDEQGEEIWSCQLNSYGKVRSFQGEYKTDCPFRYQGQYEDGETGLYYNRFRYYSPEEGIYISQDPIGLAGSNPTFYAYVHDPNSWLDVFGLNCSSDATVLRKNMQVDGVIEPGYKNSAHHIIMSNSKDTRMTELRDKMKKLGIDKNASVNGAYLPTSSEVKKAAGTNAHSHSKVHTDIYKQNVYDRLKDINAKVDFENELMDINDDLMAGTFKI